MEKLRLGLEGRTGWRRELQAYSRCSEARRTILMEPDTVWACQVTGAVRLLPQQALTGDLTGPPSETH